MPFAGRKNIDMAMRDWITKDFSWKLASLIVAAVIWHIVHTGMGQEPVIENPRAAINTVTFTNLPVLIISPADGEGKLEVKPKIVTVTVSGASQSLDDLKPGQIHPVINLTGIVAANDMRKHVDVYTPAGVTLVRADPPEVSVTILPPAEKKP